MPDGHMNEVMIDEYPGEYVQGDFIGLAGETRTTRNDDQIQQRLRLRECGRWYEIRRMIYPRMINQMK